MSQRSKELAEQHWNGYVQPLVLAHGVSEELAKTIGFHYVSAFCHGYKHSTEDQQELARRAMSRDEPKITLQTCATCQSINCKQRGKEQTGCSFWSATPSPSMPFQPHETDAPVLDKTDTARSKYDCAHYRIEDTCDAYGKGFDCTGCDTLTP